VTLSLAAAAVPAAAHSGHAATVTSLVAEPYGVSVQSADNAWAVSLGGTPASDAILYWNGTGWARMTYPGQSTGAQLHAVTALSASDAWAVGDVAEHWGGTSWTQVAAPIPVGSNGPNPLDGVSGDSPSDVRAVGGRAILHWDGTSWTQVTAPTGTSASDVAAISPTDAWLVGQKRFRDTLAEHWDGTSWTRVHTPTPTNTVVDSNARLFSVSAVGSDDVWAVGRYTTDAEEGASLALHWNGTSWTKVHLPAPGVSRSLFGVYAVSPSLAWAVGDYNPTSSSIAHGLLLQWNGTAWKQVPVPQPGSPTGNGVILRSVSASSASNAWAVGYYQAADGSFRTLMMHWDGTHWTRS
jgi:hypothetical protein